MLTDLFHAVFSNVWSAFLAVLFFGASIFVHELGHFLAARRRGAHVERFSIGFGPAIWSRRGKDGVEYRLSWFPLGGYVLLPQLADLGPLEGEVATDVKKLPPIEYGSKLLILVAGAAFNVLFAFLLASIIWLVGEPVPAEQVTTKIGPVVPTLKLADGSVVQNPAAEAGMKMGDIVRAIDGHRISNFEDRMNTVALGSGRTADGRRMAMFEIERDGKLMTLEVHPILVSDDKIRFAGIEPADDVLVVDEVMKGSPAEAAGVQPGDRILAIDGKPVSLRTAVSEHLAKNSDRPSEFLFQRGKGRVAIKIQPRLEEDPKTHKQIARIGIAYSKTVTIYPTPWAQVYDAAYRTYRTLEARFSPNSDVGTSTMSGVIGMTRELHREAQTDIRRVLWLVIIINVNLAILNLLPIPVLDGGQIVFATISRLRRRELPIQFVMATQSVFFVLILSLILYVAVFDVRRIVREWKADHIEAVTPVVAPASAPAPTPAPAPATAPAAPKGK